MPAYPTPPQRGFLSFKRSSASTTGLRGSLENIVDKEEDMQPSFLTREGYQKLQEELDYLRTQKRQEIADRLHEAMEGGELIENAEYEAAKNEQAFVEGKIARLENILRNARIISDEDVGTDVVQVGSKVILEDYDEKNRIEFTIVGPHEADPIEQKISDESPVGKALLGHRVGDLVDVVVPAGTVRYRIMGISR